MDGGSIPNHGTWYISGCLTKFGILAILLLKAYIIVNSTGMETVPWIVNSNIHLLRYRGTGGGIPVVANSVSSLLVGETFLTLTEHLGLTGVSPATGYRPP